MTYIHFASLAFSAIYIGVIAYAIIKAVFNGRA